MSLSTSKFPVKNLIEFVNKVPRPSVLLPPFVSKVLRNFNIRRDEKEDQKDKYKISMASPKDVAKIKYFIERSYFCNEPLAASLKMCYKKIDGPFERFIRDIVSQGTSLIATGNDDKLVGLCLSRKFCHWHPQHLDELANISSDISIKKLLKIWALLSRETGLRLRNSLADEDIFDLEIVWAERNDVLSTLMGMAVSLARDLNYSTAKIDCTNFHLQQVAQQLNMVQISEISFDKIFIDDGKNVHALPPRLDSHATSLVLNLNAVEQKDDDGNKFKLDI